MMRSQATRTNVAVRTEAGAVIEDGAVIADAVGVVITAEVIPKGPTVGMRVV